jgi:hypothetical protein
VQQARRANEAQLLGHSDEVTQPPQIEVHGRQRSPARSCRSGINRAQIGIGGQAPSLVMMRASRRSPFLRP